MKRNNSIRIKPAESNTELNQKNYKEPIKEILSSSSLAYLLSPIRSKRLLIKFIWIIFLILFLLASVYYCTQNIIDYLKYDTTTSIESINEQESEFPTISFCMKHDNIFEIEIKDIWFNNQNLIKEWQNHIESYQDLVYGQCYRFNSGLNMSNESTPIKRLKTSGLDDGLWLDIQSKSKSDSLVVFIHNYTQIPATIYNKGRFISNDSNNYLIIKRIYEQKLELPYNTCYKNISQFLFLYNQTIINYIKSQKREYSQKACFYLCRNLKFNELNYCKCKLPSYDHEIWSNCWKSALYSNCYEAKIKGVHLFLYSKSQHTR